MPTSLSYYAPQVDQLRARRGEMLLTDPVTVAPEKQEDADHDVLEKVKAAIAQAGERQQREEVREVLRTTYRALKESNTLELDSWTLTAQVDQKMVEGLEQLMAPEDRDRLQEQAELSVPESGLMSPRARADRVRVHFERHLRDHFSVPDLVETLG